jgi:uroporphyrin-III C-methyltransferase/precorrin-2 dehydrogenase/sirohydrochlorin ferrochelatase
LVAIGTGGASAGLAAALRQRLEALLPARLGELARALHAAREKVRARWPDSEARRRALGMAMQPGGALDPSAADDESVHHWLQAPDTPASSVVIIRLRSADPDDLSIREARLLGQADRVYHAIDTPSAVLDRARADAVRLFASAPDASEPGLTIVLEGP